MCINMSTPNRIDDYLRKGFVIVKEKGGKTPPSTPLQCEVKQEEKQSLQDILKEIEPVQIEEIKENPLMMNGLYVNQMNRAQMMAWMDREGLSYNKRGTKAEFLKIYDKYKKELKANKRL